MHVNNCLALKSKLCFSRKYPYPPHGRSLEIPRGRGVLKIKIFEGKLEFPGGKGSAKQPSVGGVWILIMSLELHIASNKPY